MDLTVPGMRRIRGPWGPCTRLLFSPISHMSWLCVWTSGSRADLAASVPRSRFSARGQRCGRVEESDRYDLFTFGEFQILQDRSDRVPPL